MFDPSRLIDKILVLLHPPLKISNPVWSRLWMQEEKIAFRRVASLTWSMFTIAYVLHLFLIDLPLHKSHIELWAAYRFGLASLSLATVIFINSRYFCEGPYCRFPAVFTGLVCSYFQAQSMIWRPELPYFFSILVPVCTALSLNISPLFSVVYLIIAYLFGLNAWLFRTDEFHMLMSTSVVGLIYVSAIRARSSNDVRLFITEQTNLSNQIMLSEIAEFSAQIAHDIRSPLAALTIIEKDLALLPEETRLMLVSATRRVRDIANLLLEKNRVVADAQVGGVGQVEQATTQLLSSIIEGIVTEKRMQFRSIIGIEIGMNLDSSSYGLFAEFQATEFKSANGDVKRGQKW